MTNTQLSRKTQRLASHGLCYNLGSTCAAQCNKLRSHLLGPTLSWRYAQVWRIEHSSERKNGSAGGSRTGDRSVYTHKYIHLSWDRLCWQQSSHQSQIRGRFVASKSAVMHLCMICIALLRLPLPSCTPMATNACPGTCPGTLVTRLCSDCDQTIVCSIYSACGTSL